MQSYPDDHRETSVVVRARQLKKKGFFFARRENGEELYCPESRVLPDFRDRISTSIFEGAYVYHGIKEFTGDGRGRIGVAIELFSLEELASFGIYLNEQEFLNNEEKAGIHWYDEEEKNLVPRPSPEMPVISKVPPPSPETPVHPRHRLSTDGQWAS